jgi:hypothetical protein
MAAIVLPDDAKPVEHAAALDLQRCLRRMSGAQLPIVAELRRPKGICVDIGATARGLWVRERLQQRTDLGQEAAAIDVTDESVILVGRAGKHLSYPGAATGHAVYMLLEQLGVRWLQPTAAWEIVPARKNVRLPHGTQIVAPYFERRGGLRVGPNALDDNWQDTTFSSFTSSARAWGRRVRLGGPRHIGAGHSYHRIISTEHFEEHPEYFGLYNGKRQPLQLCTTNPEVIRRCIDQGLDWLRRSPAKYVCISPNDGTEGF